MRMHIGRQPFGDGDLLDNSPYAAGGKPPATGIHEQCSTVSFLLRKDPLPGWQVSREGGFYGISKWNVAFFFPFATNQNNFIARSNVMYFDANHFGVADSASVK